MNKEEKTKNFKRIAASRTNNILKKLRILSNCANRSAYEYSKEEIDKIFSAIEEAVRESKSKFYFPKDDNFKL